MKQTCILVLIGCLLGPFAIAQPFKLLRFEEDYSGWKDSSRTGYHNIKYMALSKTGNSYLSFGGELRAELDYVQNEDWGEAMEGQDLFLLQRYQLHADLHLGKQVRLFAELRTGLEDGRNNGPRSIDEDQLNLQNLFLDFVPLKLPNHSLLVRLGRQELRYGSGRLIDVRDGPNLRLYFDGVKIAYTSPLLKSDAFLLASNKVNPGRFDNLSSQQINLWGTYTTVHLRKHSNVDVYYIGYYNRNARFDDGIAKEIRHSIGTRFWKIGKGFVYNFEAIYQTGKFGEGPIQALALSSEIGYQFANKKGTPELRLRSDYISGDKRKGDSTLGTFNAMYPNGGYFGMNPQVGPANLISFHPNLSWHPGKRTKLTMEVVVNWRNSLQDGIYEPNGLLRMASAQATKRYIGTAYIATISWRITAFLNYNIGIQYFQTGDFIRDQLAQPKDGFFVGTVVGFKF